MNKKTVSKEIIFSKIYQMMNFQRMKKKEFSFLWEQKKESYDFFQFLIFSLFIKNRLPTFID
jgi:hypothetical protein